MRALISVADGHMLIGACQENILVLFFEDTEKMHRGQPICHKCGRAIWGKCLYALGESWHPEHFVCMVCQLPIQDASFQVYEGQPCHSSCYAQRLAARCVYCGKPLTGQFVVDHWGQHFCVEHQAQFPLCAYCGRMVPPQQREPGAQVVRCPICRAQAIESDVEARPLFSQLVHWLTAQGLTYNNLPLRLELCDRTRLNSLLVQYPQTERRGGENRMPPPAPPRTGYATIEAPGDHTLGTTTSQTYTQNGRVISTTVTGVSILQGLPSTLFQGVTVHELGHVWLIVLGIQQLPPWAEEGFCELLSYQFYQQLHTPESEYYSQCKERNPDPIYGDGFRSVRASAERLGFARFIATARTTKRLPL
jgi:Protein of unknown function (DUF3633)./LIM domain.